MNKRPYVTRWKESNFKFELRTFTKPWDLRQRACEVLQAVRELGGSPVVFHGDTEENDNLGCFVDEEDGKVDLKKHTLALFKDSSWFHHPYGFIGKMNHVLTRFNYPYTFSTTKRKVEAFQMLLLQIWVVRD